MLEHATVPSARGSMLVPDPIGGHRVGVYPGGLVFAEGHPAGPDALCPGRELVVRLLDLQEAIEAAGLPLPKRERPFSYLGAESEGFAGLRRVDVTANMGFARGSEGVALLAGIAACMRDSPGHAEVRYGLDRAVETVYMRGYTGKRVNGRWYDKGLESLSAPRGALIRGEDQRRWDKASRRDPAELDGAALRSSFQRRFYPLYQAAKGVIVAGPMVVAEKLADAVAAGELTPGAARRFAGDVLFEAAGYTELGVSRSTAKRSRSARRKLGIVLADGLLQEVEVDVGAVLEVALESEAWGAEG